MFSELVQVLPHLILTITCKMGFIFSPMFTDEAAEAQRD